MTELCLLAHKERSEFFEVAAYESQKSFGIIEKDYWVVWILNLLFQPSEISPHLTFKGGTSLSKIYGLIERFSEDIDVSIEQSALGFVHDLSQVSSRSKQKILLDTLSLTCAHYIQQTLLSTFHRRIISKLGTEEGWQLVRDPDDTQTLLFYYPSSSQEGYIRPMVKIEMGARAEHWPVTHHKIESYAKTVLKDKVSEPTTVLQVLNAERTFWEKATILHQYAHLPDNKPLPLRLSRHFYDFFQLLNSHVKAKALEDVHLLERVANHKKIYFASSWAQYESAKQGSLKLIPSKRILNELEKDYKLMNPMFFLEAPQWHIILSTIQDFETEFNT